MTSTGFGHGRSKGSEEGGGSRWRLVVGCNLEGEWLLHWGITYCDELGSEWDQPPPEMIPPAGLIPIKDYAIEKPLKKSSAALETQILHEVLIDFDSNSPTAAIHFVIKEEETGAWLQNKGRDFRISLKDFIEEDNASSGKQGFSI